MDIKILTNYGLDEKTSNLILKDIEKEISIRLEKAILQEKKNYEAELNKLKCIAIIEKELILAGARNLKATLALIDINSINFEKFNIKLIKEKINELKSNESTSFLFFEKPKDIKLKGFRPLESNLHTEKSIENMNYEELCKYYEHINII